MAVRQTRIYAPIHAPYDNHFWAETMMARIIRILVEREPNLKWIWFTRYATSSADFGDSDESHVPEGFFSDGRYRSLRFRFEIEEQHRSDFERIGSDLIRNEGCWIADWRDYGIDELCSDRFVGEIRDKNRRDERLPWVKRYLESVSRLTLHSLVPADSDGRYRVETNDHIENPHDSAFFSMHHLFCNTTEVFLTALVVSNGTSLECGTRQYPPPAFTQNNNLPIAEVRIRF